MEHPDMPVKRASGKHQSRRVFGQGQKAAKTIRAGLYARVSTLDQQTLAALLAVFAGFEREILGERVRAGMAHARQNGKRLGRPATAAMHTDKVSKLSRPGLSKSEIARRLNIGRTSVRRILAAPAKKK
jgi:DNA invertase Pin-like site-specific DNA recombinase